MGRGGNSWANSDAGITTKAIIVISNNLQ